MTCNLIDQRVNYNLSENKDIHFCYKGLQHMLGTKPVLNIIKPAFIFSLNNFRLSDLLPNITVNFTQWCMFRFLQTCAFIVKFYMILYRYTHSLILTVKI